MLIGLARSSATDLRGEHHHDLRWVNLDMAVCVWPLTYWFIHSPPTTHRHPTLHAQQPAAVVIDRSVLGSCASSILDGEARGGGAARDCSSPRPKHKRRDSGSHGRGGLQLSPPPPSPDPAPASSTSSAGSGARAAAAAAAAAAAGAAARRRSSRSRSRGGGLARAAGGGEGWRAGVGGGGCSSGGRR